MAHIPDDSPDVPEVATRLINEKRAWLPTLEDKSEAGLIMARGSMTARMAVLGRQFSRASHC
jgi:hypothetical protein